MRILIDTHTFLWFFSEPDKLTPSARDLIEDVSTSTMHSVASLWEISIKNSRGTLDIEGGFERLSEVLSHHDINVLHIDFAHTLKQNRLPFHHKDPFDRMIAAQALVERINLVSSDDMFDKYFETSGVKRIW